MNLKEATTITHTYFTEKGIGIGYRKSQRIAGAWLAAKENREELEIPAELRIRLMRSDPTANTAMRNLARDAGNQSLKAA